MTEQPEVGNRARASGVTPLSGVSAGCQVVKPKGLKTFRCRVRASGCTTTVECLAPTAAAAAWVIAREGLHDEGVSWVQVAVSEWSPALADYIVPDNVIIVAPADPAPEGADQVVFYSLTSEGKAPTTSGAG